MKYGIVLGLILLVLLSTTVFAASPVFTGATTATDQNVTGTDRNYVDLDTNFYSPVASDADEDLNELSCEFSFDAGASWFKSVDYPTVITYSTDTNKCGAVLSNFANVAFDDLQIGFRISDDAAADALSDQRTWWLDNNAPDGSYLITQFDSDTHINLTLTDVATNTGNGVGFKTMQYRLEGTAWNVGDSALALSYTSPPQTVGAHTLYYWVTDNFDNNSGIREIDFNIRGTAPSIAGRTTATRQYVVAGDRNYYDFNNTWQSGIISDVDGDLNELSCQISFNDGFSWNAFLPIADFNADVNKCQAILDFEWEYTGWEYVKFRVSDDTNLTTTSSDANWYLDNTAPTTVGTFNNINVITLTATDSGTPSANGVGVKRIYYAVDGGAWTSVAASTANVTVTGVGAHHIYFYSTDNFDNNESYGNLSGDVWDKPFTVAGISQGSPTCGLTMLMMLVLVAAAIVGVLGLAYTGNLNITTATATAISLITFLIILLITGQVNAVMCA